MTEKYAYCAYVNHMGVMRLLCIIIHGIDRQSLKASQMIMLHFFSITIFVTLLEIAKILSNKLNKIPTHTNTPLDLKPSNHCCELFYFSICIYLCSTDRQLSVLLKVLEGNIICPKTSSFNSIYENVCKLQRIFLIMVFSLKKYLSNLI